MKIVFVSPFFHPVRGGMETHVLSLARELKKLGHEVEVFTSNLSRDGKIKEKEETFEGIKIRRFNAWFKLGQFASFFPGVFNAIRKSNADIIHVHNFRHPITLAPFFTKKPCFLTPHWPEYPSGLRARKMDLFAKVHDKVLAKSILRRYKKVCAVSASEIPYIMSFGVPKERIALTPNAIDKKALAQEDKRKFRVKYGFKENDFVVLSLSRLHKSKGFDLIVALAKNYPQIKFVIAGKDEGFKETLEKMIHDLMTKNVFLIGELSEEDKQNAFASCNVFIHPSHFEAFGIVVLEAMAQSKPVIAARTGGIPWIVSDAGLLFEDNDVKDLDDKFKRIVYSPVLKKRLGEKAFKRASQFTWDKVAKSLEGKYYD